MTAHIEKVYDLYVSSPANPDPQYLRTFPSEDRIEIYVNNWFSRYDVDGAEIEVRTMWRKYYETL